MSVTVITPSIRPKGLEIVQNSLSKQTMQDFEWLTEVGIPEKGHDLNESYNKMLKRAKGELIVFYQDWIKIPKDGLEKFWEAYKDEPKFYTAPVGKVKNKDFTGEPEWDWRNHPESNMDWKRWEIDWGAAPLEALKDIGGFDEALDQYWSFDNVNTGLRAREGGYEFGIIRNNKAIAYDHDEFNDHPFRSRYNPDFHNQRLDKIRKGEVEINYI
jgi:hypothetical protein